MLKETQLTFGKYGHTLNAAQVFSPDDQWVVYDTRNDDTHIGRTGRIEKVNVRTGEIVTVYTTENQTLHGPGVGAVAFHPLEDKIIFIHGLQNSDEQRPYGFTRRFGAICNTNGSSSIDHAEARAITTLMPGALRGGTHAHTWSGDGEWISFTYNDHLMEAREKETLGRVKDLRTIGVMAPGKRVQLLSESAEEFSGMYFSVVAATVTENPAPGSDEIERAFDECWIGKEGYVRSNGSKQKRAIAFQGNVRSTDGALVTEVFVCDLPEDITKVSGEKSLEGTRDTRPNVPAGLIQRRVTFTSGYKYPGLQGPRVRLRTSPDGREIYFPMKDVKGVVQVFSVPTIGGRIHPVTQFEHPIQAQFNVSPDGMLLSCVSDNSIWLVEIATGKSIRLTERVVDEAAPVGGALWSHRGDMLVFNRYVKDGGGRYLQIVRMDTQ